MSKFVHGQTTFIGGELSPEAEGRTGLEQFKSSCSKLLNFIVAKLGGARKRPGTEYVREVGLSGAALIPFIFSKTQAYIIAIKPINETPVAGFSVANFIEIYENDSAGTSATLFFDYKFQTFLLDPKGFSFAQSGDVMFITHSSYAFVPMKIIRDATGAFHAVSIQTSPLLFGVPFGSNYVDPQLYIPYLVPNSTSITMDNSATTGFGITLTCSVAFFTAGHVGASFKISHAGVTGVVFITSVTIVTPGVPVLTATGNVTSTFGAAAASTNWEEHAWSNHRGWPATVVIYEGRAVYGGTFHQPAVIRVSTQGNLFHMMDRKFEQDAGSATDITGLNYFGDNLVTDPFDLLVGSQETNKISWLSSGRVLQAGTLGGEYSITGSEGIFSRGTKDVRQQTSNGGSPTRVVRVDNRVVYVSREGRRLRDFAFSEENGSHVSVDLSLLASHLYKHGTKDVNDINFSGDEFVDMAFQSSRSTVWLLTARNELVGVTIVRESKMLAWHKHEFTGTDFNIWGIASIPSVDGTVDDLYLNIQRTINGVTKYYLEKMGDDFNADSLNNTPVLDSDTPRFSDSHMKITFIAAASIVTGLGHLEGEVVTVTANGSEVIGATVADFTVTGGQITLPIEYAIGTVFVIGLTYEAILDTQDMLAGSDFGSPNASVQKIDRVVAKFYKTYDAQVGGLSDGVGTIFEALPFGSDIFTGNKKVHIANTPNIDVRARIKSSRPYPCNILSLTMRGVTHD
jgi:hypothetical protein